MERPTGVTVLAILAIIAGVFAILFGLLGMAGGALLGAGGAAAGSGGAAAAGGAIFIGSIVILIIGAAYIAFAVGAWTLKPWAWMLGLVVGGLDILRGLFEILVRHHFSAIVGIAISAIIVWYLMQPAVKAAFGQGGGTPAPEG